MKIFQTISVLLTTAAAASYINHKIVRLPPTIGLMALSMLASLVAVGLGKLGLVELNRIALFVNQIDFEQMLLHGMLALLLFAGALHVDLGDLKAVRLPLTILSTVGVAIAAVATGALFWAGLSYAGMQLPLIYALLFGALTSPTDPIAVLGIIRKVGAPKVLEAKIAGESLFNDGVGVVVFLTILSFLTSPQAPTASQVLLLLLQEAVGGAAFGLAIGYAFYIFLKSVDAYQVEILLTLALACGGYTLAEALHLSAPIAIVVAGLLIGNQGRSHAMSETTRQHLDTFWELIDEILNSVLFVLIGLELIVIPLTWSYLAAGLFGIAASLVGRYVSVILPIALPGPKLGPPLRTGFLLTWGGLRGGISIALALSLPSGQEREMLLAVTYLTVSFSVLVQGLTFGKLIGCLNPAASSKN